VRILHFLIRVYLVILVRAPRYVLVPQPAHGFNRWSTVEQILQTSPNQ